ncbi:unnamed protein product [Trichobilharzia szidati]|nr:unnamed protein product [Trichobilharzia szidati]
MKRKYRSLGDNVKNMCNQDAEKCSSFDYISSGNKCPEGHCKRKINTTQNSLLQNKSEIQLVEENAENEDLPGTWVECSFCSKWRYLPNVHDPTQLDSAWHCALNPKYSKRNSPLSNSNKYIYNPCEEPEDLSAAKEDDEFIFGHFAVGSVVWAKIQGYPDWPAMVYYNCQGKYAEMDPKSKEVTYYYVVFLDPKCSTMSRVQSNKVHKFTTFDEMDLSKVPKRFWKRLQAAGQEAESALLLSVKDRIATYGYDHDYEDIKVKNYIPKVTTTCQTEQTFEKCIVTNVKQKRICRWRLPKASVYPAGRTENSFDVNHGYSSNNVHENIKDKSQVANTSQPSHVTLECTKTNVKRKKRQKVKDSDISPCLTDKIANNQTDNTASVICTSYMKNPLDTNTKPAVNNRLGDITNNQSSAVNNQDSNNSIIVQTDNTPVEEVSSLNKELIIHQKDVILPMSDRDKNIYQTNQNDNYYAGSAIVDDGDDDDDVDNDNGAGCVGDLTDEADKSVVSDCESQDYSPSFLKPIGCDDLIKELIYSSHVFQDYDNTTTDASVNKLSEDIYSLELSLSNNDNNSDDKIDRLNYFDLICSDLAFYSSSNNTDINNYNKSQETCVEQHFIATPKCLQSISCNKQLLYQSIPFFYQYYGNTED